MSPVKSALAGLAVGLIAYFVASNVGAILPSRSAKSVALIGAEVSPSLAPGATEVPNRGTNFGTKSGAGAKTVAPTLAPAGTNLAPSPSVSVTPRISTPTAPSVSPSASATPRVSVAPNPTPTPSPTASPTPTPSLTPTSTPTPSATPTPSLAPTPSPTLTPVPSTLPPSITSHVVINEVAWAGTTANASDEWIELYNAGDGAADLAGWSLQTTAAKLIDLKGIIGPGEYFLIERTDDNTVTGEGMIADVFGSFGGSGLSNSFESLWLQDAVGTNIDEVAQCQDSKGAAKWCGGFASPDYTTLERVSPLVSGSDLANWASNSWLVTTGLDALGAPLHGTPKFRNSVTP